MSLRFAIPVLSLLPGLWAGPMVGPASAQDLIYSNDASESCSNAVSTLPAKRDCIGKSASACMEATAAGFTTVGMSTCLDRELSYWDGRLNAAYKTVMAQSKRIDAETGETGPSLAQPLLAAQRAWLVWRENTCKFERAQWGWGTGGGPAALSCMLHMTAEQALYLEFTRLGE